MEGIVPSWGRILAGYTPCLSVEITRECPLSCPGCYAYGTDHLGGGVLLRDVRDLKGPELVEGVLALVKKHKPVHVSIVGGEPLVRFRELNDILPKLAAMGIHTQIVTSAVRPIPEEWADIRRLQICVSIDGLQPEHDARRKPATYDRILKHIEGHDITVHCTVTRQQAQREGYLEEFVKFWSAQSTVKRIWMSLYTPQVGEVSAERLTAADRRHVIDELSMLRVKYPKLDALPSVLRAFLAPPESPDQCIFARTTTCVSADFQKVITPCQFGGTPDCADCGCLASVGLAAVGRYKLPGGIPVGTLFEASLKVGAGVRWMRQTMAGDPSLEIAAQEK